VNVFTDHLVAKNYDWYYQTDQGKSVDQIKKTLIRKHLNQIFFNEMPKLGCGTGHWYYSSGFELPDGTESKNLIQPAFIASIVQKN